MNRLALFLSLLLLSACTVQPAPDAAAPTFSPTQKSQETEMPAAAPSTDPTEAGQPESAQPSSFGPWLMLPGPDGLFAFDTAAGTITRIDDRHFLAPQDVNAIPAPSGGALAYITGENGIDNLTLNILRMPRGLAQTQPLIAPEFYPGPDDLPGDPPVEAVRALFEVTSLAWSPDGKSLAFIGVLEGPSADVYVLPLVDLGQPPGDGRLVRLTDSPSQAIQPLWSPDGQYVVHAAVDTFGTGAGYTMTGVWLAKSDGSGATLLYDTDDSNGESFLGWVDNHTLLVHSWRPACGNEQLRTVDLVNGEVRVLWKGPFNGAAFDSATGNILLSLDQFTAACSGPGEQGLYFLPITGGEPVKLSDAEVFLPHWDAPSGFFLARTPSEVLAVDAEGNLFELQAPEPSLPAVSLSGWFAWAGPASGVWIGRVGEAPQQVFAHPAFTPAWAEDGITLYFLSEEGLHRAAVPDFVVSLVVQGAFSGSAFWLQP